MRAPHMPFTAAHDLEHDGVASAVFNARVIEGGFAFVRSDNWAPRANAIAVPGARIFVHATRWGRREIIRADGVLADVGLYPGQANVAVAAASEEEAGSALEQMRGLLPAPDPSAPQEVTVTFWTYGAHGPQPAWRTISVPAWGDITDNYSGSTTAGLARLMEGFQPAHGGQLILWHGEVGTGQTFALRALAWEWRDWCNNPAVARPGRSAANVRFDPLTPGEASAWLSRHGLDDEAPESAKTIAELYARLEGLEAPKPSVGSDEQ